MYSIWITVSIIDSSLCRSSLTADSASQWFSGTRKKKKKKKRKGKRISDCSEVFLIQEKTLEQNKLTAILRCLFVHANGETMQKLQFRIYLASKSDWDRKKIKIWNSTGTSVAKEALNEMRWVCMEWTVQNDCGPNDLRGQQIFTAIAAQHYKGSSSIIWRYNFWWWCWKYVPQSPRITQCMQIHPQVSLEDKICKVRHLLTKLAVSGYGNVCIGRQWHSDEWKKYVRIGSIEFALVLGYERKLHVMGRGLDQTSPRWDVNLQYKWRILEYSHLEGIWQIRLFFCSFYRLSSELCLYKGSLSNLDGSLSLCNLSKKSLNFFSSLVMAQV